jgi:hypothetical protein
MSPAPTNYQPLPRAALTTPRQPTAATASTPELARAEKVLYRLHMANAQIPVKSTLVLKKDRQPSIRHQGLSRIVISEGLLERCETEGQLASVLALELGKMTREREQRLAEQTGRSALEPPMEVPIGRDAGRYGDAELAYRAEMEKFGIDRRKPAEQEPISDPKLLARQYLSKAGYPETELEAVPALLQPQLPADAKRLPPIAVPGPGNSPPS